MSEVGARNREVSFAPVSGRRQLGRACPKGVMAHIGYLQDLLEAETLRASGPLKGIPDRPAMLIISAPDRQKLDEIISEDPFAKEG